MTLCYTLDVIGFTIYEDLNIAGDPQLVDRSPLDGPAAGEELEYAGIVIYAD